MKSLNQWARQSGYADFDTYIQTGGRILDARKDIQNQIRNLQRILADIDSYNLPSESPSPERAGTDTEPLPPATPLPQRVNPQALIDDPPDPHNAQIQGADEP